MKKRIFAILLSILLFIACASQEKKTVPVSETSKTKSVEKVEKHDTTKEGTQKKEPSKGIFFKAEKDGKTVHLLGSIHLGNDSIYPLNEIIEEKFAKADQILFEIDHTKSNQMKMAKLSMKYGMFTDGSTIESRLSPELFETYIKQCEKMGVNLKAARLLKPWLAAITLELKKMSGGDMSEAKGIENYFKEKLTDAQKIIGIETVEDQLQIMGSIPMDVQIKLLDLTLNKKDMENVLAVMLGAWTQGDTKILNEVMMKDYRLYPELDPIHKKLFVERNINMANRIDNVVQAGGTNFVIIGAGHFVGKDSVVEMLEKKGYKVSQI